MRRCARHLLLTVFAVALCAPTASAVPVYESDFSDYLVDWWPEIDFVQNTDTVTFTGDESLTSTTAQEGIPIDQFDLTSITLDVTSASEGSDMRLAVSYWTESFVELGWGYIDDVTGAGTFGGLVSSASFLPPVGTDFYRVRLEMMIGVVVVDNVVVSIVPEPETAPLLALGLVVLCAVRRREALA